MCDDARVATASVVNDQTDVYEFHVCSQRLERRQANRWQRRGWACGLIAGLSIRRGAMSTRRRTTVASGGLEVDIVDTTQASFTVYHVFVKQAGFAWLVMRRYSDFKALHKALQKRVRSSGMASAVKLPSIPGKSMFKMSATVVADRVTGFRKYLQVCPSTHPTPYSLPPLLMLTILLAPCAWRAVCCGDPTCAQPGARSFPGDWPTQRSTASATSSCRYDGRVLHGVMCFSTAARCR